MAIITGHHRNGTPVHSFSNYDINQCSSTSASQTPGNGFFSSKLINQLPEKLDQGLMITHGQQPSLMPIHEVGG